MPSKRPRITDLLSKIGLRAPCTQKSEDYAALPWVESFYRDALDQICKQHYLLPNVDIQASREVEEASDTLLRSYGPAIWPDVENRPWLYALGDGWGPAKYEKELYYSDLDDRELLRKSLYELIVEKVMMYRKRKASAARAPSDTSFSPAVETRRSTRRQTMPGHLLECVGCSARSDGHLDAAALKQYGIWLGDHENDAGCIHGASFDKIREDFYDATLGDKISKAEPTVVRESDPNEVTVTCAACQEFRASHADPIKLQLQLLQFNYEDDDQTEMVWFVWSLSCVLNGKEVFALVRKEDQRSKSGLQCWSFWQVDGGYTKSVLLVSSPQTNQMSSAATSMPQTTEPQLLADGASDTHTNRKRATSTLQADQSDEETPASQRESIRVRTSIGTWRPVSKLLADTSADRHVSPTSSFTLAAGHVDNVEHADEYDSLYDTTPRPEERTAPGAYQSKQHTPGLRVVPTGLFRPFTRPASSNSNNTAQGAQHDNSHATLERQQLVTEDNMPAPAFSLRVKVWLLASWKPHKNLVYLDDSMTVQDFYGCVRSKLARKLEGKAIEVLSVRFQPSPPEEDILDVEVDDSDAWEAVLEIVRTMKIAEIWAVVTRAN